MDLLKESQIRRLLSLVEEAKPRIIALDTIYKLKREVEKPFEEHLKNELGLLRYEVLNFLQRKIYNSSPDDLKKISGIYFMESEKEYELLPFIVDSSFSIRMDENNQLFGLAGSGFTKPIKMEDIRRREIADSFEEIKFLLVRISGYWKGIASLDLSRIEDSTEEFSISFNLSGLIHENAKSLA